MNRVKTCVFISGRGSNMDAIARAARDPAYPCAVVAVLANTPEAKGLEAARAAGIEAVVVDHRPFGRDREAHERVITQEMEAREVELIALAGYMRILTPSMTGRWAGRMVNIHPSLLPLYPGLHTHRRALAAGDKEAGCTVHLVTEGVDQGPILGQARTPILPGDTEDALAARVLKEEHVLYPVCLAAYAKTLRTL